MTGPHDRRGFLAGLALVPFAGPVVAASTPDTDHELDLALRAFADAETARDRSSIVYSAAVDRFYAMGGPVEMPAALIMREDDMELRLGNLASCRGGEGVRSYGRVNVAYLRRYPQRRRVESTRGGVLKVTYEPWPEAQARADEIVAAWDAWKAEEKRREDESGLEAARTKDDIVSGHVTTCGHAVAAATATTAAGMLRKAGFVVALYTDDRNELDTEIRESTHDIAVALSIVRDLVRLQGVRPA